MLSTKTTININMYALKNPNIAPIILDTKPSTIVASNIFSTTFVTLINTSYISPNTINNNINAIIVYIRTDIAALPPITGNLDIKKLATLPFSSHDNINTNKLQKKY